MGLTIYWSDRAELEFVKILNYWNDRNGSNLYSKKLITLFEKSVRKLSQHPESGRLTEFDPIR